MREIIAYLSDTNIASTILRLLLAVICGGIIGLERGKRRQAAGFRTHILVCMGSALVMITNIQIIAQYSPGEDPTRIAAQVVSGIGFLGVGTIIVTGTKQIKGLTTAAGLWASACMGISIGAGHFVSSIIACCIICLVMTVLNNVERRFYQTSKVIDLYIEFQDIHHVSNFLQAMRDQDIKCYNIEMTKSKVIGETATSVLITLNLPYRQEHSTLLNSFGKLEGVNFIEEA